MVPSTGKMKISINKRKNKNKTRIEQNKTVTHSSVACCDSFWCMRQRRNTIRNEPCVETSYKIHWLFVHQSESSILITMQCLCANSQMENEMVKDAGVKRAFHIMKCSIISFRNFFYRNSRSSQASIWSIALHSKQFAVIRLWLNLNSMWMNRFYSIKSNEI